MLNLDNPYGFTTFYYAPADTFSSQLIPDLQDLGCRWWRPQYRWLNIERAPGVYTWTYLDAAVAAANTAGINIAFPIQDAPSWHLTQTCGAGGVALPGAADTATFAAAVAARYNGASGHGTIQSIEIGNEEYDSKVSCLDPTYYVPVLKAALSTIKDSGFRGLIGCAATLQRDTAHLTSWYQTFYGKGCGPLVDYLNFHYYNCPHGPNGGNSFAPTFHLYWQLLSQLSASNGFSGMDVWCTETGYPTSIQPDYDCTVTEEMRRSHFQITLDDARSSGVISHLFWYTIDSDRAGTSITLGYPPTRTYTPTYGLVKNYIATYPTWSIA